MTVPVQILVSSPYPEDLLARLSSAATVIAPPSGRMQLGYDEVRLHAPSLAAVINQGELRVDEALIAAAPHLRIVANASIGVNNLALAALRSRRAWCTNTPAAFADATADWLHAVLHAIEGDTGNSRYWYRRCGKLDRAGFETAAELAAIRASLSD